MSHVSISKSYTVLVGIEGYMKTRQKIKKAEQGVKHGVGHLVHPHRTKEEEEKNKDTSESAEKERRWIQQQKAEAVRREEERKKRRRESIGQRLMRRLHIDDDQHPQRQGRSHKRQDSHEEIGENGKGNKEITKNLLPFSPSKSVHGTVTNATNTERESPSLLPVPNLNTHDNSSLENGDKTEPAAGTFNVSHDPLPSPTRIPDGSGPEDGIPPPEGHR